MAHSSDPMISTHDLSPITVDVYLADDCTACDGKGTVVEVTEDGRCSEQCTACAGDGAERCVECNGPASWLLVAKDNRARTICDVERVHTCDACIEAVKTNARANYARRAELFVALRNARCRPCVLARFVAGERADLDRDCTHNAVRA